MPNLLTQRRFLRPWRPDQIHGLALWLDAADRSTITIDTGVSEWRDKSGHGRTLTQSNGALQPSYVAGEVNGLPVVRTDGTDDRITSTAIASTSWYGAGKDQITFIALMKRVSATGRWFCALTTSTGGGTERILFDRMPPGVGTQDLTMTTNSTTSALSSAPEIGTSLSIETITWTSGSPYELRRYINGSATSYQPAASLPGTMELDQLFTIGLTAQRIQADFCEFLVWPRVLSNSDLSRIESYLTSKWGPI